VKLHCKLEQLIIKSGLRKDFIANKLEISTRQLRNYELQKNYIPMDKAYILSELLNCKLDDLYERCKGDVCAYCTDNMPSMFNRHIKKRLIKFNLFYFDRIRISLVIYFVHNYIINRNQNKLFSCLVVHMIPV
jgi:hypothetical protein